MSDFYALLAYTRIMTGPSQPDPTSNLGLDHKEGLTPRVKHTVDQIMTRLREAEVALSKGQPVIQIGRTLGVPEVTYYRWRNGYGGLTVSQVNG